ncbi:Altronate oxidoreductase [Alteracholeplasma palmae J233]|uniref:Altronate oxidoreductase n=1 Tax=Alteracholeplasma palmae (strain ATCC 49389 / J233) TaxID=1318466 RepID=U4KRE2_ALTPJ|nr:tagaturonate reductase [Alteracholeplasma palmae]CCV64086.1 Altronate oxidoreductase [Alteracholeplasma palmae J233]
MEKLTKKIHKTPERPISIMQFGEGNFLRAFVDDFIQKLNDQKLINMGVVVVQPMPFGRIKEMKEQDGLYTLFLQGLQNNEIVKTHQVIDVLSDFVNPYEELNKYLEYGKSEDLQIVISNTTEAGIVYEEEKLSREVTPNSFPGKLLLLLNERFNHFKGDKTKGLEIVPCELIDYNGDTLKEILIKLAKYNGYSEAFIDWISNDNKYYNTLVDRIVPGYPKDEVEKLEKELGYVDHSMVKGEIFHLWVLQGPDTLKAKLPFDKSGLNVLFADSIVPYKQRKVKILNGSHTALVPVSYLLGIEAVKESVEDPRVSKFIKGFIYDEVVPTIDLPQADMHAFAYSVIERYSNPFVHHLLLSIALNSMSKYKSRNLPTVLDLAKQGKFASHALFSLAALIVFYRGVDEKGNKIPLNDDPKFIELFEKLWAKNDIPALVKEVLELPFWETEYLKNKEVVDYVTKQVELIVTKGMKYAVDQLINGAEK